MNHSKIKFETKLSWVDRWGVLLIVFLLIFGVILLKDENISIGLIILIVSFSYVLHQFLVKKFTLVDEFLFVSYPSSFFLKKKKIPLKDIKSIKFLSNNAVFDPNRIKVIYKNNKRKTFFL